MEFDPASFKDPAGRVFYHQGSVYRTLTDQAFRNFQSATDAGLVRALVDDHLLVPTEAVPASTLELPATMAGTFVLKHARIPVVTYPYEWSFEMLRDAALVTLRVIERALADGFILKDATSFNVLFDGSVPKLIDTTSIEPHRDGELWAGYGQFCRCFLFPLLLASYRGIDMQALLRGALGEVTATAAAHALRLRDFSRPGVLKDVVLQARLQRRFGGSSASVKAATSWRPYPTAALIANVRRLMKIVEGLTGPPRPSDWCQYSSLHSYTPADRSLKAAFVDRTLVERRWLRVVDLGCNTGEYSQVALRSGSAVIAVDMDSQAIDQLYKDVPGHAGLSPVVSSLLNPTPAMGWGLSERRSLFERIPSDGFLALALIHHLRITGGVPLAAIISQFFAIAPEGIIEWVDKDDQMVRAMLSLRPDVYDDYTWMGFESALREQGDMVAVQATNGGQRRLCHVRKRAPAC